MKLNRCKLIDFYYQKGMTYQTIADICGISKQRVGQLMKKYGLTAIRNRSHQVHRRKYKSLEEYFEVVKQTGIESKPTLSKFLLPMKKHCQKCGSTENLHSHHLKYPALSIKDTEILCASCHYIEHRSGNGIREQLEICNKYIEGKNGIELAAEYNMHPTSIYYILKKFNIKRRARFTRRREK